MICGDLLYFRLFLVQIRTREVIQNDYNASKIVGWAAKVNKSANQLNKCKSFKIDKLSNYKRHRNNFIDRKCILVSMV